MPTTPPVPLDVLPAVTANMANFADLLNYIGNLRAAFAANQTFCVTATITSAAAATAVPLIADALVGTGRKLFVLGYMAKVNGVTDWGTTATVKIQDTNGTPVDFVTLDASKLDGSEFHGPLSDSATIEAAMALGTGGTSGKGLQLIGDANGTGSDLVVTVWGVIRAA